MITSLEVGSWPIISWSAQNIHRIEFVHLESLLTHRSRRSGLWCGDSGESRWSGMTPEGVVGLSWHWSQIAPEVFALTDPMAIECNLALLASDGGRLSPMATSLVLNRIVAGMPWQVEAARAARRTTGRRIDTMHAMQPQHLAS